MADPNWVVGYMGRMVDDCYILISSSEAFSDAFILPYYPPCITHYPTLLTNYGRQKQRGEGA